MVSGRQAGGRVPTLDYLLLVKLDASRRFREYLSVGVDSSDRGGYELAPESHWLIDTLTIDQSQAAAPAWVAGRGQTAPRHGGVRGCLVRDHEDRRLAERVG